MACRHHEEGYEDEEESCEDGKTQSLELNSAEAPQEFGPAPHHRRIPPPPPPPELV